MEKSLNLKEEPQNYSEQIHYVFWNLHPKIKLTSTRETIQQIPLWESQCNFLAQNFESNQGAKSKRSDIKVKVATEPHRFSIVFGLYTEIL